MLSVQEIAKEIVAREGGYVNDPDDPGGATKYGVTIGTMRKLGLDLTGDGTVTVADVKALSVADAERIFIQHYFRRPGLPRLPSVVQPSIFDMYVNAGSNAVKIFQRLLCEFGRPVSVDGVIGPITVRNAEKVYQAAPNHLSDAYGIARRNYYYRLGDRRAASRKYARRRDGGKGGWIRRAEEFISPKYHLTDAQHKARVSAWA